MLKKIPKVQKGPCVLTMNTCLSGLWVMDQGSQYHILKSLPTHRGHDSRVWGILRQDHSWEMRTPWKSSFGLSTVHQLCWTFSDCTTSNIFPTQSSFLRRFASWSPKDTQSPGLFHLPPHFPSQLFPINLLHLSCLDISSLEDLN